MRSRLLGLIGALALAIAGIGCATGSTVPGGGDGGQVDAATDVEPAQEDGPRQDDAPGQSDGTPTSDATSDGTQPSDGPPPDGTQPDAGCTVQITGACDPVCQTCTGQKCTIDSTTPAVAACVDN